VAIETEHRAEIADIEPAFKEGNESQMAARVDVPRAPCKDRASEKSGPVFF